MPVSILLEQPVPSNAAVASTSATAAAAHRCSRAPKPDHCDMVFGVACPDAMNAKFRSKVIKKAHRSLAQYLPSSKGLWTDLPLRNHKPSGGQHTPLAEIAECAENLLADNGADLRPDLSSIHQQALYCFVLDSTGELIEICYFGMSLEFENPANGNWEPLVVQEQSRFKSSIIPITLSFRFAVELK